MTRYLATIAVAAGLFLFAILAVLIAQRIVQDFSGPPEIILTILLIIGVIALVGALAGLLALHRTFGLANRNEALGLPPGSIRAILALMLVLVFAIMSVFLYYQSTTGIATSRGITQEQVDLLPQDRITAIRAAEPLPDGTPTFDVDLSGSTASQQLAQQLITLLGTLVTAIAAFYFGSNSVTTALKSRENELDPGLGVDPEAARAAALRHRAVAETSAALAERLERVANAVESVEQSDEGDHPAH
jgi:hypothetical protein